MGADVNDFLAVRLRITDSMGRSRECPVLASGVLAWEDFPETEWDRLLPWRFLDLSDVVPPGVYDTRQIALDVEGAIQSLGTAASPVTITDTIIITATSRRDGLTHKQTPIS